MATRVLLADDHKAIREGLRALLAEEADMEVVGEATDGQEAVRQALALKPDIVLLDVAMPGMGGLEACRCIREASPETRVVALSMYSDRRFVRGMAEAGASGYLLKDSAPEDIVTTLRVVLQGGTRFIST